MTSTATTISGELSNKIREQLRSGNNRIDHDEQTWVEADRKDTLQMLGHSDQTQLSEPNEAAIRRRVSQTTKIGTVLFCAILALAGIPWLMEHDSEFDEVKEIRTSMDLDEPPSKASSDEPQKPVANEKDSTEDPSDEPTSLPIFQLDNYPKFVRTGKIVIHGFVNRDDKVQIQANQKNWPIEQNGNFKIILPLKRGPNHFTVLGKDQNGKEECREIVVHWLRDREFRKRGGLQERRPIGPKGPLGNRPPLRPQDRPIRKAFPPPRRGRKN